MSSHNADFSALLPLRSPLRRNYCLLFPDVLAIIKTIGNQMVFDEKEGVTLYITLTVLIVVIFTFMLLNIKNRYASVIASYLASITFMLFIAAIYISKLHYYNFPLKLDYALYLKLSTLHIAMSQVSRLYSLGFALFMLSSVYGAKQFLKLNLKSTFLFCLPIFFFLLFTAPDIAVSLHIHQYSNPSLGVDIKGLLHSVCLIIIVLYSVFPCYYITKFYRNTQFRIHKLNSSILAVCIVILNVYFYSIFIFGTFKSILFCNVNPAGLPIEPIDIKNYLPFSLITFVMLASAIIILMVFKPFNLFYFRYNKNKDIIKSTELLNTNLSSTLHMYKNMFWGARQQFELIKVAMQAKDYDAIIEYADDGIRMTNQHFQQLQHTLNAFNTDTLLLCNVDIVECMELALAKSKPPFPVNIEKDYAPPEIFTYGNQYILTEAFSNLIINSMESFEKGRNDNPTILIKIHLEDNICMIELTDNGCGIPQKNLKNIFSPFYSTKTQAKNFGIGLNFVKKIIKSYHGTIAVSSKVNKYTTFQITIPISTKTNRKEG